MNFTDFKFKTQSILILLSTTYRNIYMERQKTKIAARFLPKNQARRKHTQFIRIAASHLQKIQQPSETANSAPQTSALLNDQFHIVKLTACCKRCVAYSML